MSLQDDKPEGGWAVLSKCKGSELVGLRYKPLFPFFEKLAAAAGSAKGAFRVVSDGYVTDDSGTGIVHQVRGSAAAGHPVLVCGCLTACVCVCFNV